MKRQKNGCHWELNPRIPASALPLSYDSRTTASPHNLLYVLQRWDWAASVAHPWCHLWLWGLAVVQLSGRHSSCSDGALAVQARYPGWSLLTFSFPSILPQNRNLLLFRCENIFIPRKCMKILYANKFYNGNFFALVGSLLHTRTSPIAAAHISLYTW